jgi:hypothetical protein
MPSDRPIPSQNIDAGVDYNRPVSLSRRTSMTLTSGIASASDRGDTHYYGTGGVGLSQEIGRSWTARLTASRSLSYLDGFANPFLTDGVATDLGGYFSRRVDFVVAAAYANSDSTLTDSRSRLRTYTGSTRLRLAFSRYGSAYMQYFYYQYRFRDTISAVQGLPPMMERRGARVGVTMWVPLLR